MSKFRIEVVADDSGKWYGNAAEYDAFGAAHDAALDLAYRWLAVRQAKVVEFESEGEPPLRKERVVSEVTVF